MAKSIAWRRNFHAIGLLVLRVGSGGMMLCGHGWEKLTGFGDLSGSFPDPLGVGSTLSLSLAVFAEVFCSLAIMLGLMTRLAALPLMTTMVVAAFVVHADDPWSKKEFALVYLLPFATLLLTGPGRLALDSIIWKKGGED